MYDTDKLTLSSKLQRLSSGKTHHHTTVGLYAVSTQVSLGGCMWHTIASRKMQAKAGPDPESAVHASKCFSSRKEQRPMEEKILSRIARSSSVMGELLHRTVIPSRICDSQKSGN